MDRRELNLVLIYLSILLALIGPISVLVPIGQVKDLRFLSPIILIPLLFVKIHPHKREINKFFRSLFLLFLIVIVNTLFVSVFFSKHGFTYRNIVNIVLTLTPLIFSWAIIRYVSKSRLIKIINFFFWAFVIFYVAELFKGGVSLSSFLGVFTSNIATESYYDTESGISLIMGFYCLFYLHRSNNKLAFLAGMITILGAKRVAIFGLFICLLIYLFFPVKRMNKSKRFYALIFCVAGFILASFWDALIAGTYNNLITELTGISPNRFFMGRLTRFGLVFSEVSTMPIWGVGYGLGYLENILYYSVNFASAFHGDFYRLFLEFGVILFGVWLYLIGKFSGASRLSLSLSVLLILLMQTDNAFIYNRVMFSYYLIIAYSLIEHRK